VGAMGDFIFVGLMVAFFIATALYIAALKKI
jgi:hypothetical protein